MFFQEALGAFLLFSLGLMGYAFLKSWKEALQEAVEFRERLCLSPSYALKLKKKSAQPLEREKICTMKIFWRSKERWLSPWEQPRVSWRFPPRYYKLEIHCLRNEEPLWWEILGR